MRSYIDETTGKLVKVFPEGKRGIDKSTLRKRKHGKKYDSIDRTKSFQGKRDGRKGMKLKASFAKHYQRFAEI